jgi:hypothetical protein
MNKPLGLLLNRKTFALLLLLAAAVIYCTKNFDTIKELREGEGGEENESAAEVLGAWDMMGGMRSWPNPNGEISAAAYSAAYEHMKMMPEIRNKVSAQSRVEASNWIPLGPMNFSGRILSLGFDPVDPNIIWAGSASGGLWRTTTGGTGGAGGINWTQIPVGSPIMSVPAIGVNPQRGNTIYIGTGEVYNTGTANTGFPGQNIRTFRGSYGIGILKSTDGGGTWFSSLPFTNSTIKGVQDIVFDPADTSIVFAATSDGVYRTIDAGASWTLIHNVVMAMDICADPNNPDIIYVGCGDFNSAGSGIYKCSNARAATPTFTQLTTGLPTSAQINGCIRLKICPDNSNLLYASIGKIPGSSGGTAGVTYGLFKSTNAGANWAANGAQPQLAGSNYIQNQGWYAHDVLVSKTSVNTIYVSEIDMTRSTNGGTSFTKVTDWSQWDFNNATVGATTEGLTTNYVHADQHHLYFGPFDATQKTVYVVCDGGIFRSTDGGTTWIGLNGGLMTAQLYHKMGMSAGNSNLMICGLQDNATLWYTGSTGCKRTTGGDGFYSIIDQTNDNICFGTYSYMTLYRSTTGPGALGGSTIFNNPASTTTSLPAENAAFVAPVVMAPSDHMRVYGGTINFKKSTDNGQTFTNIAAPLVNANAPIIYIGMSKTYADSVYVATCPGGGANARIYSSANGGTTFSNITGSLPNRYFSSLAVDPTNSKRVAVTICGFGTSHVYLTPDGGITWNDIGGVGGTALPDVPANVAMWDPTTPSTLYVGTDMGVFVAQNITTGATQANWYSYNAGWTDVTMVMDLQVAPNGKLRAGTYGKGLWENSMVVGSLPVTYESFNVNPTDKGNLLTWTVGVQDNVNHYEVEYSNDGVNYSSVASVQAKPGTHITYSYLHKITNNKVGYYRIKEVDMDGNIMYSAVEMVKAQQLIATMSAYPNPTIGMMKVTIPTTIQGKYNLKIYDASGKLVLAKAMQAQQGVTQTDLNISGFAAGNYQLVCQDDQSRYVTRIVKR